MERAPHRWRFRLVAVIAWWAAGWGVDRFVCRTPDAPASLQIGLCVAFGVLSCVLLVELAEIAGFRARAKHEFLIPAAAYALLWGRHHFLNFFYWDEITRFGATRLSPWELARSLFEPVANGHVMPLAKLYWYAVYSVFRGEYIGVAAGSFVFAIAGIAGAHALLRVVTPPRPRFLALVAATLLAATPHSPIVTLWKGAGDSLQLSLAEFLASMAALAAAVLGRIEFDRRTLVWIALGLSASVLSSSLVTVAPIYLIPFGLWLAAERPRRIEIVRRFRTLAVLVTAVTIGFWLVRELWIGVPFPATPWTWSAMLGSLRGAIEVFLPSTALRAAFLAGCAAMAIAACRPTRRPVSIVWLLGLEMFVAGTLQVVLARGMVYEAREMHAQYHLYLAFSGLALACAAMVVAAGIALSSIEIDPARSRLVRTSESALVAGSLAIYVLFQHLRVERLWPVMTAYPLADACAPRPLPPERTRASVICAREDLRRDLARYVAAGRRVRARPPPEGPPRLRARRQPALRRARALAAQRGLRSEVRRPVPADVEGRVPPARARDPSVDRPRPAAAVRADREARPARDRGALRRWRDGSVPPEVLAAVRARPDGVSRRERTERSLSRPSPSTPRRRRPRAADPARRARTRPRPPPSRSRRGPRGARRPSPCGR